MNYSIVRKVLGILLVFEAFGMIPCLIISRILGESDFNAFMISILITFIIGMISYIIPTKESTIKSKEALCIVSFGWVVVSFFGALPFVFSGSVPSMIDAFFEMVSGFTTTGATIINDIEVIPKGILFWR
ncbi:potassium transporter TrkG [Clostridium sp. DL1XJH146]